MKQLQLNARRGTLALLLAAGLPALADVTVTGTVLDSQSEPVIGATVLVKGTHTGTSTDLDGRFTITAPSEKSKLVISYVGCLPVEINAESLSNPVILTDDAAQLDEVLVIGYGTVKKNDATGSITAMRPDNANRGAGVTAQDALVGKIAGVNVVSAGGQPGSNATMRIRSGASLSASNEPLIVVDGVPLTDANISDINPTDIDTFTVLKDASATAIYGSRASNGVIVITTKRGNKRLQVNYSGNATVSTATNRIKPLSASEYKNFMKTANITGVPAYDQLAFGDADTDWQDHIYRTAFGTDHNVAVSGSIFNTPANALPFRVSVGYTDQQGVIKTNDYQRVTGAVNLNPQLLNKHLDINLNANISYARDKGVDNGVVKNALIFDPTQPVHAGNREDPGCGYFIYTSAGSPSAIQTTNPVAQLELDHRLSRNTRSIGNAQILYRVHGLEDLKANVNLGYDVYHSKYTRHVEDRSVMTYTGIFKDGTGMNERNVKKKRNYLLDAYLDYSHTWAQKHEFEAMAGYGWQHFWKSGDKTEVSTPNAAGEVRNVSDRDYSVSEHYLLSWYGRLNYNFDQRYLITASFRADASSRFAKENRWGYFPSVAVAWRIIGEEFMSEQNVLSDLKLRASYGVTGQQEINNDYPWMGTYSISLSQADYMFGDNWFHTYRPNAYDRDIKWETTETWNVGVDYGFLNNRIFGSVDYYRRYTKDLLNNINVPSGVNFAPVLYTNIGSMRNQGVEVAVNAVPIQTKDWTWTVGVNYTWQNSKITKLNVVDSKESFVETGMLDSRKYSQVFMVGEAPYTYHLAKQAYDEAGKPIEGMYVQPDGSIAPTETRYVNKHGALPHSLLGFNTRLTWKNWELSLAGHGMFGNYVYNYIAADQSLGTAYSDQGYLNNIVPSSIEAGFVERQLASDYWLENGSFFKFDNLTVGYTFPHLWNTTSSLRLTFAINNLCTITKYSGVDPEVYSGIDKNIYPRPRSYAIGVNLNF